ncbi:cytochrome P450 [Bimuria novae-zelandiae CBS 107.79]|uniref:Cytochrome P450 n=1 Tax=Bimuria novae-zelandiae CBS 107.79 TaxID=1447943 RepID=A0A6A5UYD0_9PLEO|nr:cytochrome P450 [Bimuria novae-zelandiae CBS 107.79]
MFLSEVPRHLFDLLTPLNILLTSVALITLPFTYQIIYYRFFHSLRKFPGPFWASVTRLWIAYHNILGDECELELALHKRYGPVLRITPTLLLVSDATKLPEVYHRQVKKSNHYITGSFGEQESLFNMREHKVHAYFRKIAAGPYAFSNIKKMEPLVDVRIEELLDKLSSLFAERNDDVGGLIQGFHDGLLPFGLMARLWPFTNCIKKTPLGKFLVAKPEDNSGIGTLMRFRDKLLGQRLNDVKEGKIERVDLLQTFIDVRDEDGKPLEVDYIKAEMLLVLLAGADTTGTAFQAMMAYIMGNEGVYERLMREIDDCVEKGLLSDMPQYDEVLQHCPYYVACVKESMRLCPSAPNIFPRLVGPTGLHLNGQWVPPNTEITCNPWLVHRDTNIYGPNACDVKLYNRYNMAFGYGARVCLGKDIALMELYKAPLQFFKIFKPVVNRQKPERFVVKGGVGFWEDMWVRIERRVEKC